MVAVVGDDVVVALVRDILALLAAVAARIIMNIIAPIISGHANNAANGKAVRKELPVASRMTNTSAPIPSIPSRWFFPPWL